VRRVAGLFNAVADTYDNVDVDFFQLIAASLLHEVVPVPGERWLDVGCGRGAVLLRVAQAVAPAGHVVGIDISENMLARARASAAERELSNVDFYVRDAQQPDLAGERFDTVTSSLVLFFVPDPGAAVRAWRDLLVPGGRVGVTTFGSPDPRWASADAVMKPYLGQPRPGVSEDPNDNPFASDSGVEQLLTYAGFVDVQTVNRTIPIRFPSVDKWFEFSWSTGQRAMWLALSEEQRAELRSAIAAELHQIADPDGAVRYDQKVRHTLGRQPA